MTLYIQYGCGFSAPGSWRNYDSSPTLYFERVPILGRIYKKNRIRFPLNVEYGNILEKLPIDDGSCHGIYCSHVLEHFSLVDFRLALHNTFDLLQPGGIFRLVMPDLEYLIKEYISNNSDDASLKFMRDSYLGHEVRIRTLKGLLISWLGNSQHLWMWDYKSLKMELQNSGFVLIRRADFGDSVDVMFNEVEEKSRWDNNLGVECKKPV